MAVAQSILNSYRAGITIMSVQMQEARPPEAVQEAFDDVLRAREEKDTRINEALAFESQVLPEARGEAERIRQESEAYRARRIAEAQAEADRFLNILREYESAPDIIATRMYLETLDQILPRVNQIILTGDPPPVLILNTDGGNGRATVIPATVPSSP